jgi:hypothetical protein
MPSESSVTPHSILEKFEFYFLGLTFTLLGAAIQTAAFTDHSHVSVIAEIIGWAGFAVSGLVGLSKVEHLSVVIYLRNRKNESENNKSQFEQAKASGVASARIAQTGEVMAIDAVIFQVGENATRYTEQLDKVGKRHEAKDIIQRWAFVLGLLSVAVARAYDAVAPIICG